MREATYDNTDEQRALIELLQATQQSEAVRYLCHDLWEKDRKGKAMELAAKAGGKGHKKKKKAKNMTDLDAVQKATAKIREKVDKKRDQRAERKPGDDASREQALLAEYDGHAAPGKMCRYYFLTLPPPTHIRTRAHTRTRAHAHTRTHVRAHTHAHTRTHAHENTRAHTKRDRQVDIHARRKHRIA